MQNIKGVNIDYLEDTIFQILNMKRPDARFIDIKFPDDISSLAVDNSNFVIFNISIPQNATNIENLNGLETIISSIAQCYSKSENRVTFATALNLNCDHFVPLIFNNAGEISVGNSVPGEPYNSTIAIIQQKVGKIIQEKFNKDSKDIKYNIFTAKQGDDSSCGPITTEVIAVVDPNKPLSEQFQQLSNTQAEVPRKAALVRAAHQQLIYDYNHSVEGMFDINNAIRGEEILLDFLNLVVTEYQNSRDLTKEKVEEFLEMHERSSDGAQPKIDSLIISLNAIETKIKFEARRIKNDEEYAQETNSPIIKPLLKLIAILRQILRKITDSKLAEEIENADSKLDPNLVINEDLQSIIKTRPGRP